MIVTRMLRASCHHKPLQDELIGAAERNFSEHISNMFTRDPYNCINYR